VAAVFSVVPGEMGAALIRRDWGETLDDMAQNFPWQFAGNLQKWVGRWDELPADQHMLIALCAPRPVYVNGGLSDQWSDPKGEFLALMAAGPVYRLLGGKGLGVSELPPLDAPVTGGDLAFHYHSGGHTAVPADWRPGPAWPSPPPPTVSRMTVPPRRPGPGTCRDGRGPASQPGGSRAPNRILHLGDEPEHPEHDSRPTGTVRLLL
jgi:hypothetical protein